MKRSLNRRDFLKLGVFTAGAAGVPSLRAMPPETSALPRQGVAQKVIVVGAGLAGLSAAYALFRAEHEVIVLEAQMRSGGRVLAWRAACADGL